MEHPSFSIGGRMVGLGFPPYIVAEAGVHHRNSIELAEEYVRQAKLAGADAVKFQTYRAEKLATRWAPAYWDTSDSSTQYEVFSERSRLAEGDYQRLFRCAADLGIDFLSTPFDPESAAMLNQLGMLAIKVASGDLTHSPLLELIAGFGKPILLSTGASTLDEVEQAARTLRAGGAIAIALLHCSLAYPTRLEDANLPRIGALQRAFPDCVVGYSDHTLPAESELPCPLGVARGAAVVEKHFTLDRTLPGDDHYHSVDPAGLTRLVKNCRDAWIASRSLPEVTSAELAARRGARRSIVAAREIPMGKCIEMADIDFKRPGTGIPPTEIKRVLGRRAARLFLYDELIEEDGLAPA